MNNKPNTIDWQVGDLVIHDADEKSERYLMEVISILPSNMIRTVYKNRLDNCRRYTNSKGVLHDPSRFGIGAPVDSGSKQLEIYACALNQWGTSLQLDMFIEEAAEAIQAVQHYKRDRCNMDTVCGELADLQIMLEQAKCVFGRQRFEKIFADKLDNLEKKLNVEERQ